jgi:hypothetical protein
LPTFSEESCKKGNASCFTKGKKAKKEKRGAAPFDWIEAPSGEGTDKKGPHSLFPFFLLLSFYEKTGTILSATPKAAGDKKCLSKSFASGFF